jgi:Flp pilus assembly protein TadD
MRNLRIILILAAGIFLGSCANLSKMAKNADLIKYEVAPPVLEMHGDYVDIKITGQIPEKYFLKKATMVAKPVIKYGNSEKALKTASFEGEKVKGNARIIKQLEGGKFEITDRFPYSDEMRTSTVEMKLSLGMKKKSIDLPGKKIGDGIVATPRLVNIDPKTILGKTKGPKTGSAYDPMNDEFQRIVPENQMAALLYMIQRSEIRPSELKKEEIKKLQEYIISVSQNPKQELKGIELASYASPDGPEKLNDKLSKDREKSANQFLNKSLKKQKVTLPENPNLFTNKTVAEDWDGFQELMKNSNIQDKDLILRILSMYSDTEVREKEIKNISAVYKAVADQILPQLRRTKFNVNVNNIGKSDEELLELAKTNPETLNPAEMIYAANLTTDESVKLKVYKAMAVKYPNDWRGHNNSGAILVRMNKAEDARKALETAKTLDNNRMILNNLGAVELLSNNFTEAENFLKAAMGAGSEVDYNLGIISVKKGSYADAISKFGTNPSFNLALAQTLNKDYTKASATLSGISEKNSADYYLAAIVGARNSNEDQVISNLKSAIQKDPSMASKAKGDVEFIKYFENAAFQQILK